MSTQTIVIGQTCTTKNLVPIEFSKVLALSTHGVISRDSTDIIEILPVGYLKPTDYKFIELICKNYYSPTNGCWLDLMFAYEDKLLREKGLLILGKWNDGVVE